MYFLFFALLFLLLWAVFYQAMYVFRFGGRHLSRAIARWTRRNVLWTASSASSREPSRLRQKRYSCSPYSSNSRSVSAVRPFCRACNWRWVRRSNARAAQGRLQILTQ